MSTLAPFDNAPPANQVSPATEATQSYLRATKTALDAIVAAVTALEWGDPPAPAFARVELFDDLDLVEAFKRLLITESRIALVIYSDESFSTERDGRQLIVRRQHRLWVLFTDRVIGKRTDALLGTDTNPGLFVLRDLILPAITKVVVDSPQKVYCTPVNGSLLRVEDNERKLPGRLAYSLECQLDGGYLVADLGRSPIV